MQLPLPLLDSLKNVDGFDREAFKEIHTKGEQVTSIRINPLKPVERFSFPLHSNIPWTKFGFYLEKRPSFTFDPLFHAGCYYVQEASSMFLEQALQQTVDLTTPLKVLDLCAAPGGKSTHLQSLLSKDSLLVSNETIRSRANILKEYIIKWGCENVVVTNNDPAHFGKLPGFFDVIVVDAPCSGSGLFRRDPAAINEWSENNVQLCCQRQQRILADVWPALKKNGILIYSTCSYSKEEDEDILDWIGEELDATDQQLQIDATWNIIETVSSNGKRGYRFWPDKVKGEGFFISVFRKNGGDNERITEKSPGKSMLTRDELAVISKWTDTTSKIFVKNDQTVYGWPAEMAQPFNLLIKQLRVVYSGTIIGELIRDKLLPDHALAMSNLLKAETRRTELDLDKSIAYLQRKDIQVEQAIQGWQLVTYMGHSLGWINVLPNRINNYYPKELRILKDKPENREDVKRER